MEEIKRERDMGVRDGNGFFFCVFFSVCIFVIHFVISMVLEMRGAKYEAKETLSL